CPDHGRHPYPPHYRAAFAFSHPSTRTAFGWPDGFPTSRGRGNTGLPRSARLTRRGEVLSVRRERWVSMTGYYRDPVPAPVPFGSSLAASLAWCSSRRLSRVHICSPYPPSSPVSA